MKFLHTADLHIGRTLEGQSRLAEQQQVLLEITEIIKQQGVDLLLIAGDIFDTYNPSAEAEGLFYDFVDQVTSDNCCGVVIIAGNHDQPERLAAANALAAKHAIYILASPNTVVPLQGHRTPQVTAAGANWLELTWSQEKRAVIAALPYLSEGRAGQLISQDIADDKKSKLDYSQIIRQLYQEAAGAFQKDTVNIAMGHLFAVGGVTSDSERVIQVGGSLGVGAEVFPPDAQYIALGHLHRKQQIKNAAPCYYSGSPLACGFGETDQTKAVLLVEAEPGQAATVREIPLLSGYPLHQENFDGYEQAVAWCGKEENHNCWLNIKIESAQPLTEQQIKDLRSLHPRLLRMEIQLPEAQAVKAVDLQALSNADRFALFVQEKTGVAPQQDLIQLFVDLTEGDLEKEDLTSLL